MLISPPLPAGCGSAGSSGGWVDRWGEVLGARGVAQVGVAQGTAPQVGALFDHRVGPAAVGLHPVMGTAQRGEVAGAGGSALVVGDDVVLVAAAGWALAPGEHAGAVSELDVLGQLRRHPVPDRGAGPGVAGPV